MLRNDIPPLRWPIKSEEKKIKRASLIVAACTWHFETGKGKRDESGNSGWRKDNNRESHLADCHIQINFYTRQPHHVPCNDRHLDAPAARKIMHTPSQTRCSSKRETSCNRRSLERNFRTACQIVLHTQEKRAKGSQIFSVLPLKIQARLLIMQ